MKKSPSTQPSLVCFEMPTRRNGGKPSLHPFLRASELRFTVWEQLFAGTWLDDSDDATTAKASSCPPVVQNVAVPHDPAALLAAADPAVLGPRIRRARLKIDITQAQLAGADASTGYISRIEAGKRRPDLSLLEAIAARLSTTAEALLTGQLEQTSRKNDLVLEQAEFDLRSGGFEQAAATLDSIRGEVEDEATPEAVARWRYLRALTHEAAGDLDTAIMFLEDLVAARPAPLQATTAAVALSRCYRESGDFARAVDTGEACLARLDELGLTDSDEAIQLAVTVAAAHFTRGDTSHAVRLSRRAVNRAEQNGNPVARAAAYWNASAMLFERGDPEGSLPLARKALQLLDSADESRNLGRLRSQLGIIQLHLDPPDTDSARQDLEAADLLFIQSSATPIDRGRNDVAMARALLLDGSPRDAARAAAAVLERVGDAAPLLAVGAHMVIGQAAFEDSDTDEAARRYRQAVHLLTGMGSDRAASEAWFELGVLLDEVGLESEAHDAYRSAAVATGLISTRVMRRRVRR